MLTKEEFFEFLDKNSQLQHDVTHIGDEAFHKRKAASYEQAWHDYLGCIDLMRKNGKTFSNDNLLNFQQMSEFITDKVANLLLTQGPFHQLLERWTKAATSWGIFASKKFNLPVEIERALAEMEPTFLQKIRPFMDYPEFSPKKMLMNTSLMYCVSNTQEIWARTLIHAGADINKYNPVYGNNPLLLAVSKGWNHSSASNFGDDSIVPPRDEHDVYNTIIHAENQFGIIKCLLASPQLDINAQHLANGMTALHIACLRGDEAEFIQILIDKGADINIKDDDGKTPIDYLDTSYEDAQAMIVKLTGGYHYFSNKKFPHSSDVATLPSREFRQNNIEDIRKSFQHSLKPN